MEIKYNRVRRELENAEKGQYLRLLYVGLWWLVTKAQPLFMQILFYTDKSRSDCSSLTLSSVPVQGCHG